MTRDQLLDKLEKLAIKCEKDNIHVSAILYSIMAAIHTDKESILSKEVQNVTNTMIYPDLLHMAQKAEYEASVNKETLEAAEFVSRLLNELNMN